MPNLLAEYRDRHHSCSIPICHDGVCFFNKGKHPKLIILTSLACRSIINCNVCNTAHNTIIVEVFKTLAHGIAPQIHQHFTPESDLISVLKTLGLEGYEPYHGESANDLEMWLWNFCTKGRIRNFMPSEADEELKGIEQMLWAAQKQPKVYGSFYAAYEAFFPKRNYLLYR